MSAMDSEAGYITPELRSRVRSALGELEADALRFLQGLVHIPTENPPGRSYAECARYLGEHLAGLGYIVEYPKARLSKVNEEHGIIDFTAYDTLPQVGDILHIIPVHTCVVTNLHNRVFAVRGDQVEQVYDVAARGLVW